MASVYRASEQIEVQVPATVPPGAPDIERATNHDPQGATAIMDGASTNDARPQLSGSGAKVGGTVNIYDHGTLLGSATADRTGHWHFTPDDPLSEGAHTLTATTVDAAGNESLASGSLTFTVDTMAPTQEATITMLLGTGVGDADGPMLGLVTNGGSIDDASPRIIGMLSAALGADEHLLVLRDGVVIGTASVSGTDWSYDDTGLTSDHSYVYTVQLEDAAGNRGALSDSFMVSTDLIPTAPLQSAVPGSRGADTFTADAADVPVTRTAPFSINGGHARLIYTLLAPNDPTGGNGSHVAHGFHIGDIIDLSGRLAPTVTAGAIGNCLHVTTNGADTDPFRRSERRWHFVHAASDARPCPHDPE